MKNSSFNDLQLFDKELHKYSEPAYPHYIEINGIRYKKEKDGSYYQEVYGNWIQISRDEILKLLNL